MLQEKIQLRHRFKVISGSTPESGKGFYWDGDIFWVTPEDLSSLKEGYYLFDTKRRITDEGYKNSGVTIAPVNSIVLTKRAPIGLLAILGVEACSNQGCFLLIPNDKIEPRFFYYYLLGNKDYLQILGRGSTFMELSLDDIKSFKIPDYSISVQRRIADYLDSELLHIDTLVSKKQHQLELLEEQRQAFITHAVTKGINPNVRLKDSEIEWLGALPEHWYYMPLKRVVSTKITDGPHETPVFVNEGVPFISAEAIKENNIDFNYRRGFIEKELDHIYSKKCKPQLGDVLLIKSGSTTGRAAIVTTDIDFNIWSPLALIRANNEILLPKYLFYSLLSNQFKKQVELFWSFGTQPNIGMNVIENLKIGIAPISEQIKIVNYLDKVLGHIEAIRQSTSFSINLLTQKKEALITNAVNNKLNF